VSSYDNNLASWTMSGEYGHKKDRDRKYFLGQFIWSGIDYIGEADAVQTSSRSSPRSSAPSTHRRLPEGHVLPVQEPVDQGADGPPPADELDRLQAGRGRPGVGVRETSTRSSCSSNGQSLGVRTFRSQDHDPTGRPYLETTECSGDDKTFTTGTCPGQLPEAL